MHIGTGQDGWNLRKPGVGEPIRGGLSVKHDPILLPCGCGLVAGDSVKLHGVGRFDENAGSCDRLPEIEPFTADNVVQDPDVAAQGLGFVAVRRGGMSDFHHMRGALSVMLRHEDVRIVSDIVGFIHGSVLLSQEFEPFARNGQRSFLLYRTACVLSRTGPKKEDLSAKLAFTFVRAYVTMMGSQTKGKTGV